MEKQNQLSKVSQRTSLATTLEKQVAVLTERCNVEPLALLIANKKIVLGSDHAISITTESAQQSVQVSGARLAKGKIWCEVIIGAMLNEVANTIPCELGEAGIASCAKMIVGKYWYLKMDEIALILMNGMQGKYSRDAKMFHKFTFALFAEWEMKFNTTDKQDYLDALHSYNPEPSSDMRSGLSPIQEIIANRTK